MNTLTKIVSISVITLLLSTITANAAFIDGLSSFFSPKTNYIVSFVMADDIGGLSFGVCTIDINKNYDASNYQEFKQSLFDDVSCDTTAASTVDKILLLGATAEK